MGGFRSNARQWLKQEAEVLERAEEAMAGVMVTRATMLAPKASGDLRDNGRVEKNLDGSHAAVFGDASVPYARRRHFENKKNPQTLHYLKRAGDSVAKENVKKYVDMSR
jgi:hypothetical protein